MPTKEHKFELGSRVKLTELKTVGTVMSVRFMEYTTVPMYEVGCLKKYEDGYVVHSVPEPFLEEASTAEHGK